MRWTRWTEFKKRRKARYDKLSTAAPVNTTPPSIMDGGNGLLLAVRGAWDNYPTKFELVWKSNGVVSEMGDSYVLQQGEDISQITLDVTASNDNGATTVTVP